MSARIGVPLRHYRRTDSTNARARELALAGAPGGLVVTADEQSSGRGRQGRSWFAPAGAALLYSALLRPIGDRPLLPVAAPLAVCECVESMAAVRCRVKWPNDVWVGERKLAGVLIEGRADAAGGWAVIGVGLNLSVTSSQLPPELRDTATSLAEETGMAPAVAAARSALNEALDDWCGAPAERILAAYRARDGLAGRRVSWDGGSGTAAGIDDLGHLLVRSGDRTIALGAGEVHLAVG